MFKEPEKYYVTKDHGNGTCDYAVTKEWSDWDKRNIKIENFKRKLIRIIFWWAIKPIKYLSQWEIRKVC